MSSSSSFSNLGLGYSIAIALAFLVLLSTLLLSSYICCRRKRTINAIPNPNNPNNPNNPSSSDNGIVLPRIIFVAEGDGEDGADEENAVVGLDQSVINSYPKFQYCKDSMARGGGGNTTTCSICLCEYREPEMLRMMPDCRHYFHLGCLDAWLKLNGSCPVCRNSPLPTPLSTPLQEVVPLSQYAADRRRRSILSSEDTGMPKLNVTTTKFKTWRGVYCSIFTLGALALLLSLASLSKFFISKSFLGTESLCTHLNPEERMSEGIQNEAIMAVQVVIHKIQQELQSLRNAEPEAEGEASTSACVLKQSAFLADILGLLESVEASLAQNQGTLTSHPLLETKKQQQQLRGPADYFLREEIRKYVRIKPNRLGKQNFMGANGTFTSIGHACFDMKEELEEYMDYDIGEICNDDWKLAQKLMVHGCDPLPRRRCFSRAPQLYSKPFPINEALWKLPDDRNVRWSHYRCRNFACLASNTTHKGFFKCAQCFNLTHHEMPRWVSLNQSNASTSNETSDFLISDVLQIKPGEIRIGLDFSVGTGTFAARMKEHNVTVVSATINLGAPFNEMIALRGLIPLYLTLNQRLPFFDNTLDLIHTTRFLDGWIDLVLLEFVLFDWDRVLRPGGLLWIDSFFCMKQDLNDYLEAFKTLRYRKHKWVIVPKLDKHDQEVFFSAVLEKPPRPF